MPSNLANDLMSAVAFVAKTRLHGFERVEQSDGPRVRIIGVQDESTRIILERQNSFDRFRVHLIRLDGHAVIEHVVGGYTFYAQAEATNRSESAFSANTEAIERLFRIVWDAAEALPVAANAEPAVHVPVAPAPRQSRRLSVARPFAPSSVQAWTPIRH